ncbi:MAG: dihydrolipoyl dehydrogenase [bacterium]
MAEAKKDLMVIGAGPGGYPAAFHAADKGLNVTLIDKEENPGGVCLYRGCIPTKTLLHVCDVIREAKKSSEFGVTFSEPEIDLEQIREWKNRVVTKMVRGLGQLAQKRNIEYLQGEAKFIDSQSIKVNNSSGEKKIEFDKCIIATGSVPASLPDISINSSHIIDSKEGLEIQEIPDTMLVIGGGYIGLEMGTIYASLGSKVSVVEIMDQILPGCDNDLVRTYSMTARKTFDSIMVNTTVTDIKEVDNKIKVSLKGNDGSVEKKIYDKALVSIGRIPNSHGLGIENTKISTDEKGFIEVDSYRKTAEPHIYAIGDVVGGVMLAHKATHEAKSAVESMLSNDTPFNPKAIPAVLFTDPEIAWCGLTEDEAKKNGINIKVAKFPWGASGRASSLGRMDGVTKLIIDPATEHILGVGITGPHAGELISEGALCVENKLKVAQLGNTIHPHPTLSETLMEAADVFYNSCVHIYNPLRR